MIETCSSTIFSPVLRGPGREPKSQISLNFNYKVNFKDFKTELCVFFSQIMEVMKCDIHLVAWLMPQRLDLVVLGVKNLIFRTWSCGISN